MDYLDLKISISEFRGAPLVTVEGTMDACRAQSLEDVMESFMLDGTDELILDVTQASFSDVEGASSLIRTLRIVSRDLRVSVVAPSKLAGTLKCAGLEPYLTMCSSLDQVYEGGKKGEEFLTSRWMARAADDSELPLAA